MSINPAWVRIIRKWAEGEPRIAAVYAFGSRARGTHRPGSDLDLALVLTDAENDPADAFETFERPRLIGKLAPLLPVELHLHVAFTDDSRVWPAVREHGVLIYPLGWSAHPLFVPTA